MIPEGGLFSISTCSRDLLIYWVLWPLEPATRSAGKSYALVVPVATVAGFTRNRAQHRVSQTKIPQRPATQIAGRAVFAGFRFKNGF